MIGCLGCGLAPNMIFLNLMRAVTGIGGGGLITMATIVNSDMIPFERRGMYQAMQNVAYGVGSICGASLGGILAESLGWRWCFGAQVPVSVLALIIGRVVIKEPETVHNPSEDGSKRSRLSRIDFTGSALLVVALSVQLVGLSLGGNELPWSSPWVIVSLVGSFLLLAAFLLVEAKTKAQPIIPLRMLRGRLPTSVQIANVCAGMAAYAFLFNAPLFFQVVLGDTPSKAGLRLVIPSIGTPIGGVIAGYIMSRWGQLANLVRSGTSLMTLGNFLVMSLRLHDAKWKYFVYLFPANLGQGITYPSILFTFIAAFEHSGKFLTPQMDQIGIPLLTSSIEQAVSTSTTYLIRSLGTVYGVAISSAVVQTVLTNRLPVALHGVPHKAKVSRRR
jgi:predicted MFS family arabinose efflux permease